MLHKLIGHLFGHRGTVQGAHMDSTVSVLPTGVHHKGLGGRNRHPAWWGRWAWVLLSFCCKSWAKPGVSTIWRMCCSQELMFYSLLLTAHQRQLFTSSSSSSLTLQRMHVTLSSHGII